MLRHRAEGRVTIRPCSARCPFPPPPDDLREPIDTAALSGTSPADGALCLFLGVVRNENGGRPVLHLEYEAYDEMALEMLEDIAGQAAARWPVSTVRVVHRLGRLEIGEASVAVAIASPHRGEAFEACRYVIDTLKATVPIWKKEFYADGSEWLEGPGTCVPGDHR
jgi:molybdopterin synthase catalytic subunit